MRIITPASRLAIESLSAKPRAKPVRPRPATMPVMLMPSVPNAVTAPRRRTPTRAKRANRKASDVCMFVRCAARWMPSCASRATRQEKRKIAQATAKAGAQMSAWARNSSFTGLGLRRLYSDGGGELRRADAPDQGQLDPRAADAEVEAEDVELEALDAARREAEHAAERELEAAAARRGGDHRAADEVLADRGRRQVDLELGDGAGDPGGEGVRVRSGPERVFLGIGILARRLLDAADQLVEAFAALFCRQLRRRAPSRRIQ